MAVDIHPTARIDCDHFEAGDGTIIRAHANIYGRSVTLGRECFIDEYAVIGGGSADRGTLVAGHWLHMGMFSQINTARDVTIGDEVGLGIGTRVFTHGAYLSELDGFPVKFAPVEIGSRVWIPSGQVNPGSVICDDVVVAAGSVVSGYVGSGCLVGGAPLGLIRSGCYPNRPSPDELDAILRQIADDCGAVLGAGPVLFSYGACFDPIGRTIGGPASAFSEDTRNELRRHGVRFRYEVKDGEYVPWS